MIPADISITFGSSVILFIFLFLIVVSIAFLFYRFTLPPLPPFRRIILSLLRALSLTLLLFILFEPILRFVRSDEQKPTVAVLIDDSQSMTIKDNTGDRASAVRKFLKNKDFSRLSSNVNVKYFSFSTKLNVFNNSPFDSISFRGEATDLSNVLGGLKDLLQRNNIQAVSMITDGNYTGGKNPIYAAEALSLPVYTMGVGDTTEQKDVVVEKIVTNDLTFAETRIPVDVNIKCSGYSGENIEVNLAEGTAILDRRMITITAGTHSYPVRLFAEPKEEGTKKYTVTVSKLPGELTEKNNSQSFFMKVFKSKLRVLILAGAPQPDVSAVRQVLSEDKHLTVKALVQKNGTEFYESSFNRSMIDSADCLVLIGFPSPASNNKTIQEVREIIERQKKPFLFLNSKTTDYAKLEIFETLLPFGWSGIEKSELYVAPSIAERQKSHPLVTLCGEMTADGWQQLPPIYKTRTMYRAKPEADVLAYAKLQNIVLNEPLVAIRNISRQKSFAITGHGIWRWWLLAQGNSQTDKFLSLLLTNAVRWLTTKEEDKNVRVMAVKEVFTTTETIEFTGQVYDEQYKPVDNAEVIIDLQHDKEKFQVALDAVGNGRYEGSIDGLNEGDYTFTAKAATDGRSFGEEKGRFSVGQMNVEFLETKMNKTLLEQIAYRTGGRYYDLANAGAIANDMEKDVKFSPREIIHTSEIELWNWKYLAALIIILLAVEWFIRKRSGML
ncbi:MAG: hypothetical protein QME52_09790 [Bacteroidota bacterium]|nr:hypothetical protein [Bacteroidota bacterium]